MSKLLSAQKSALGSGSYLALGSFLAVTLLSGCIAEDFDNSKLPQVPLMQRATSEQGRELNAEATIPPQCYTKTEGKFNPCYTCHQTYPRAEGEYRVNSLSDGFLQGDYGFSDIGMTNHWKNLFVDRRPWLDKISDEVILEYVDQDNYSDLTSSLKKKNWQGFIPDLANYQNGASSFDNEGFAKDGSGWVAFNYVPLPSTFWPTNGSTDDVIIKLPKAFQTLNGKADRRIYQLNLALVELNIKQLASIPIPQTNEQRLGVDLDGDGQLNATATEMQARSHYLGDANQIGLAEQQFPKDTAFMHSVRYVGIAKDNSIVPARRMKELRYMRKQRVLSKSDMRSRYDRERKEKLDEELPQFVKLGDKGYENGFGWLVQGFIEDYSGNLRPQTDEELNFCMGCHSALGATIDQTFAFARKPTGPQGWGYIQLKGLKDAPSMGATEGDILSYLGRVAGGNEFRENTEMQARWFDSNGELLVDKVKASDVYRLITPSVERALKLNKAYTHIVRHQSYVYGRDATWIPAKNVLLNVDTSQPPLDSVHQLMGWDLRLDWSKAGD